MVDVPEGAHGEDRSKNCGQTLIIHGEKVTIDNVVYDSPADKQGVFDWDQVIMDVQVPSNQPPKELLWIPALVLFFLIGWVQSRRQKRINLGHATA